MPRFIVEIPLEAESPESALATAQARMGGNVGTVRPADGTELAGMSGDQRSARDQEHRVLEMLDQIGAWQPASARQLAFAIEASNLAPRGMEGGESLEWQICEIIGSIRQHASAEERRQAWNAREIRKILDALDARVQAELTSSPAYRRGIPATEGDAPPQRRGC